MSKEAELRHELEVHSVDPASMVGSAAMATRPRSCACRCSVEPDGREVGGEDVGEKPVVGVDVVDDLLRVVGDVPEEQWSSSSLTGDGGDPEPVDWHRQRDDRSFELEDLALEPIDGPGVDVTIGEDIDSISSRSADLLVDGDIVVDDLVQDCMQRRLGLSGQVLLVLFQTLPDTAKGAGPSPRRTVSGKCEGRR